MTAVLAFCVSFAFVFLKSFQQLNVQHDRYQWVLPCSLLMALMEVAGILLVVRSESVWIFLPLGLGGGSGCMTAMFVHGRIRRVQS